MSHCSFLYSANSKTPQQSDSEIHNYIEVCGARIPLLWLTMFKEDDIRHRDSEDDSYLIFMTTRESALANLNARRAAVEKLLPQTWWGHIDAFEAAIKRAQHNYINVSIEDIESMSSDSMKDAAASWREVIRGLDAPIHKVRNSPLRFLMGTGIPSSWQILLTWSGMASGFLFLKLKLGADDEPSLISGAATFEEIARWKL
jgi:hypothetical protein